MANCKKCGGPIKWVKENGRWFCFNPDGEEHWDACSKRRWEQVKETGVRFDKKMCSGYTNSVHGTKFDRLNAKSIRGAHYKPSGDCAECCPPWEVCNWPCPDALVVS